MTQVLFRGFFGGIAPKSKLSGSEIPPSTSRSGPATASTTTGHQLPSVCPAKRQRRVSGIEYQEDDEGITFTYTQDMADAVNKYICTFHSSMEGSVQTSN